MENILQGLHELEGVHGAIVIDGSGQIVAYRTHNMYDLELVQQVSRAIASAIDAVKLVQGDWESITTHYAEGKLLLRSLVPEAKGPAFTLALIADGRLNPSFATVAIRVAMGKLKAAVLAGPGAAPRGATDGHSGASARGGPGASGAGGASAPGLGGTGFTQTRAPITDVATSGLSWSGFGNSTSASGSGVAVADPPSSALLTTCTKALARSVGPMAKLFVKEAVRKVCPDRPFSKDSAEDLIAELAKSIENPADAAQFQKNLLKLL
jgi:predicted regulator of Ras-like GTPase activity (Roadblock/LC7/MglB family)